MGLAVSYSTTGHGGVQYTLDGYNPHSNSIWSKPIKTKAEAHDALALHKVAMDNIGASATKYRFDLGGEFTRSDTDTTCGFLGIHTDWVSPDLRL